MIKRARVLITSECNLKCTYCCNKLPKVQSTIKFTTMDELLSMKYDELSISGGEPMLALDKLIKVARDSKSDKIYLYTNGLITEGRELVAPHIKGVNIGCHGDFTKALKGAVRWKSVVKNIRFHIQEGLLTKVFKKRYLTI